MQSNPKNLMDNIGRVSLRVKLLNLYSNRKDKHEKDASCGDLQDLE